MNRAEAGKSSQRISGKSKQALFPDAQSDAYRLWVVGGVVLLGGWLVEFGLVMLQLRGLPGVSFSNHLSHLWYGPLLVLFFLVLLPKVRVGGPTWLDGGPTLDLLAQDLDPDVRDLARYVHDSSIGAALLSYLWQHPRVLAMTADLAYHTGRELAEVERELTRLQDLGLVESVRACGLRLYRLTQDSRRLAQLEELSRWRKRWSQRAWQLIHAVSPDLLRGRAGEASIDPYREATRNSGRADHAVQQRPPLSTRGDGPALLGWPDHR